MEEEKKNDRKKKRFAARLKSSKGIICTDDRGPNIVLCNHGQGTGLDKAIIFKLIGNLSGNVVAPRLIMEKGETHSFLTFSSTEDAILFYNTYNGKQKIHENGPPLHMSFVENVPNTEITCPHENPKDLLLINNFITHEEEDKFMKMFNLTEDKESNLKNRQVKHYGYEFRYGSNDVDLSSPLHEKIPEECNILWKRLEKHGLDVGEPDQLTVNKYAPGQGIPSHVDKHSPFGGTILSLSLGSSVVMDWKHPSGKYVPVHIEPRSLMVMQGEARYDWQHGIQPRAYDPIIESRVSADGAPIKVITSDTQPRGTRISLTFRWTRSGPCECCYKTLCDSVQRSEGDIADDVAENLEELHVHQVYEQIAAHFSTTRHKAWPRVEAFMARVAAGAVALDLGAGNGKNLLPRDDVLQIAGERSAGLLSECSARARQLPGGADCVRADLLRAALRDACADAVICVAVLHHFCSPARRLQAISTICRLLRPGGRALITVWAKDQSKSNYLCKNKSQEAQEEQRVTVAGVDLPVHENRTQFQHNDLLVPWKLRKKVDNKLASQPENTLLRYYHVFEEGELDALCKQLPLEVEESFYEEGNWCVICKKINDLT